MPHLSPLPLKRTYYFTALRAAFYLKQFIKEQHIQIVQTFFESSDIWAGFVTKAMSSAKLIWSRRDMGILRTGKHHVAYRIMSGTPDAVFAVSEQVRQHCIYFDRIDPARVRTIYNGLNLADWDTPKPAKDPDNLLITTVGNIRRVKGHDIFIKAAASIITQFPKASFSIAGEILEPAYFAQITKPCVHEPGPLRPFSFRRRHYKSARASLRGPAFFILPSRSEGFSNRNHRSNGGITSSRRNRRRRKRGGHRRRR